MASRAIAYAVLGLLCVSAQPLRAQTTPAAVVADPPADPEHPAMMAWPDIPSHGAKLYSVICIAPGAGPHPTVLMLHGFPGHEKDLDLAHSILRAGWSVLVPFYRGAWGSGGTFSLTHALEDALASIDFLRDSGSAKKFRIDSGRIVLVGHSMGGFVAAHVTAHDPQVLAAGLVTPGNLGPSSAQRRERDPHFWELWRDNASRLVGATPQELMKELDSDPARWNYMNCVPLLKGRPVLLVEADDQNAADNQELAKRLREAGDGQVTEVHMHTDHSFSDHRIAMQAAVVSWLDGVIPLRTASQARTEQGCTPRAALDVKGFQSVMETVADGWNRGDAKSAASCFAENAIYSGPPSPAHRGRKALDEFFGGAKGRELPMRMTWHHLIFDPAQQIGVGEYTFQYKVQTHGLVIVRMSKGLILNWREYEVESTLPWEQFVGDNRF